MRCAARGRNVMRCSRGEIIAGRHTVNLLIDSNELLNSTLLYLCPVESNAPLMINRPNSNFRTLSSHQRSRLLSSLVSPLASRLRPSRP